MNDRAADNDSALQRRLAREAREIRLGTLGNRGGDNVARVEVSWYRRDDDGLYVLEEGAGYFIVHASGDEPEIAEAGEFGSIYTVFDGLVHAAMQDKVNAGKIDGYQIDDIYSA